MPVCPNCYRRELVKFGKYDSRQRWHCQFCWQTTLYPRMRIPKGMVREPDSDSKDLRDSIFLLESRTHYGDWLYDEGKTEFLSDKMAQFVKDNSFYDYWAVPDPILVKCYFYVGFWCGKDNDLICIALLSLKETKELDPYLSPEGRTPKEAIRRTIAKRLSLAPTFLSNGGY